jgi:hypothetical protein
MESVSELRIFAVVDARRRRLQAPGADLLDQPREDESRSGVQVLAERIQEGTTFFICLRLYLH